MFSKQFVKETVYQALREDLEYGDMTTEAIVSPQAEGVGPAFMPGKKGLSPAYRWLSILFILLTNLLTVHAWLARGRGLVKDRR